MCIRDSSQPGMLTTRATVPAAPSTLKSLEDTFTKVAADIPTLLLEIKRLLVEGRRFLQDVDARGLSKEAQTLMKHADQAILASADASLIFTADGDLRLGPWVELRTSSDAMIGGELQITGLPRKLDMFWYEGRGVLALRAGGNRDLATAAIAYGYQAPWDLMRPRHGATRYMIGVRVVPTATQAVDDPRIWSATLGVETEPVGALRYLLGVRSWY